MLSGRYSRQTALPFIGVEGQERLMAARIGLIGCGALGTTTADLLVRAGVGYLRIIDRDVVELTNLQRQTLFTESDARERQPKAEAAVERLRQINSEVNVEAVVADFCFSNAISLISGLDLVIDGTDNFLARLTLNDACLELKVPWVYGGALGSYGVTMNVLPGGVCFRCLVGEVPVPRLSESCDISGVFGPVTSIIGALQAAEAIKLIVQPQAARTVLQEIDLLKGEFTTIPLPRDASCPACVLGKRDFLSSSYQQAAKIVCGRDSVLVTQGGITRDLFALAQHLDSRGYVTKVNRFRLQVMVGGVEMIVFSDGRALVNGTTDVALAQSLYDLVCSV